MQDFLQMLVLVIMGVALIAFGFTLFAGQLGIIRLKMFKPPESQEPKQQESCPICSSKLNKGDLVKTMAFPSITGGKDRLMHIKGCAYCIGGNLPRKCPICGADLSITDILVARIFERPNRKPHVHIAGCNKCRRAGKL